MTYYDDLIQFVAPEDRSATVRRKFKVAWYDHIKRRPAIIEKWKPLYDSARENWLNLTGFDKEDQRRNKPIHFYPQISQEEQSVIGKSMDSLMEDFEKTL